MRDPEHEFRSQVLESLHEIQMRLLAPAAEPALAQLLFADGVATVKLAHVQAWRSVGPGKASIMIAGRWHDVSDSDTKVVDAREKWEREP